MDLRAGSPHILAGAPAVDRLTLAQPSVAARWYEPMHVREPARVRDEMAAQVLAGADFLVAPTWLTHRRALVPVGETRRAREWTTQAVSVARDGAELGREQRGGGGAPRILGVLPDPDAIDEGATGRIPARDAAAERDERVQAGILAEAGVAGVLIEYRPSLERARAALRAVVETDQPAWLMIPAPRADGLPLEAWTETLAAEGAGMLLLSTVQDRPPAGRFGIVTAGPSVPADAQAAADARATADARAAGDTQATAARWLELGAQVLGIAAGATPDALRPMVEARDAFLATVRDHEATVQARIDAWIADVARRAAGGRALWVGSAPAALPGGFDWAVVPEAAIGSLPGDTWRLLVCPGALDPRDAARLVERGGVIGGSTDDPDALVARARAAGVRLDDITPVTGGAARYIGRREH